MALGESARERCESHQPVAPLAPVARGRRRRGRAASVVPPESCRRRARWPPAGVVLVVVLVEPNAVVVDVLDEDEVHAAGCGRFVEPEQRGVLLGHGRSGDRRSVARLLENGINGEAGAVAGAKLANTEVSCLYAGHGICAGRAVVYGAQ